MRYSALATVLIGLSALCWSSCASSRKATSSLQVLGLAKRQSRASAYGLHETRDTVRKQVMVAVHDTIREVTTITVQTNETGDTVKVVQITDRDRARAREAVRDKEERLVVKTDTVYIEKRDSVFVSKTDLTNRADTKKSGFLTCVKWIFAMVCAVVVLVVVIRLKC